MNDIKMMRWAMEGAAIFSTCAKRQYMAIITTADGRVVGSGYNGSPPGMPHCSEGHCPRLQADSQSGMSYSNCISVHAEANALMYSDHATRAGGTLYVNGQPCWDCGKLIAGSGLARVVIIKDPSYVDAERTNQFMRDAGISVMPFVRPETREGRAPK
jgi:dCMP deaminase